MHVLLLGVGRQGKGALYDLVRSPGVEQVIAADLDLGALEAYVAGRGWGRRVECLRLDADDPRSLEAALQSGADVVIDLLPARYAVRVGRAAIENRLHAVNTVPCTPEFAALDPMARDAGVTLLPEFGLAPGIDLVMLGDAARGFEAITEIVSYAGGVPVAGTADNPIRYRASWNLHGLLASYRRGGTVVEDGAVREIGDREQFAPGNLHEVEVRGVGRMEAYPDGDVMRYLEIMGLAPEALRRAGRYVLRWPGHAAFWHAAVGLGLLDEGSVEVDGVMVDRRDYLASALEPALRYDGEDRDMAIVRVEVAGLHQGRGQVAVYQVVDTRDRVTGLSAMSRLVGFTASIGAQMIAGGALALPGLLSPAVDVPLVPFELALAEREIGVEVHYYDDISA